MVLELPTVCRHPKQVSRKSFVKLALLWINGARMNGVMTGTSRVSDLSSSVLVFQQRRLHLRHRLRF